MNADRNLLFGILALQLNFIDRHQLVAAFDRWTSDKTKSLADLLIESAALDVRQRDLLDALIVEHLRKHNNDPEKSLAAITPAASVHEDLNRLADPDVDASLMHVRARSGPQAPGVKPLDATLTWTAGDSTRAGARFRVLRPHAKGGLGEVFVAHDEELDREVAFKEIQQEHADDPNSRGRFLLEAKVTGGLEHPGIVPVYGLGHYADGRPFYAMRFVRGDSLKEAIKRFHQANAAGREATERTAELRRLLGRFVDVCNAIAYAHSRGVLHRDLKPGNIMLGNYGETLVVDWGLAKVVGKAETISASTEPSLRPSVASDSGATEMGVAMGTPQYMSPEQAAGRWDALGPASDVYSLGATLYTVLTGKASIGEGESLDMLARVVKGDFPPPRSVDKDIPRALEAVCLKAMALKPADRYASPRALADDIEHWLNDQPVSVYREPVRQRFARWRRNHKAQMAAITAAMLVLVVGGLIGLAVNQRATERTRAQGLVDSLLTADAQQVPAILRQLDEVAALTRPMLAEKLAQAQEGSTARLHLALALVEQDEQQVEYLYEKLLSSHVSYVGLIREQLAPHQARLQAGLWKLLHDGTQDPARRFRAGLSLASYAANSDQWTAADMTFVSTELVSANPEHQPRLREYLRPLRERLLGDLERIFADAKGAESHQLSAANALADFNAQDVPRLARLLTVATPAQYAILYPLVSEAKSSAARDVLVDVVRGTPAEDLPPVDRVLLGQRRAGAAITLLRAGDRASVLESLHVSGDPESLTQFVHRCRDRGVRPGELLACLDEVDAQRQTKTGEARQVEDRVLYGLLLALGEFPLEEVPDSERERLLGRLATWYASDPSSTIHGATGWLLRHWGQVEVARKVDQTPLAYSPDRQWFTLEVKGKVEGLLGIGASEKSTYMTFVVIPAGEYVIGSPEQEPERRNDEARHSVRLTYSFALLDREVTWSDFELFDEGMADGMREAIKSQDGRTATAEEAMVLPTWYDCVRYCRWLTEQTSLGKAEQAYLNPETLDPTAYPPDPNPQAGDAPKNWPLSRLDGRGFRLPTESEWEIGARGGMRTAYGFGGDDRLLDRYGWFEENSGKQVHAVREQRPSLVGLFDMHGNVFEWCHDWYGAYELGAVENPRGPTSGSDRVYRGGGWFYGAAYCRTAHRVWIEPSYRTDYYGFRLALSPSGVAPEALAVPPEAE